MAKFQREREAALQVEAQRATEERSSRVRFEDGAFFDVPGEC
jgi:hypothetical protein